MPKIFLIKNRLHQQQQRLNESQNATNAKSELGNILGDSQPLSLIVQKKDGKHIINTCVLEYLEKLHSLSILFLNCATKCKLLQLPIFKYVNTNYKIPMNNLLHILYFWKCYSQSIEI